MTNDFPTRVGGIETFALALAHGLSPHIVVYTASMPGDAAYDRELPFPVYRDPSRILLPTPSVARRVAEVMKRHGCDSVIFGASVPLGLLAPALRRAGAERIVALTHGHEVWWAKVPLTRLILRQVGDSVDAMTYVSEWCRGRIAPALSATAQARMVRVSPGVDLTRFHPGCGGSRIREELGIDPQAPVVVCLARLVRRKGQDTLIRCWRKVLLEHPDAVLLIVGTGPDEQRLRRLARTEGLAPSVVFAGLAHEADVPAFLDAGDVFAMPCRTRRAGLEVEAWGIVFVEAQACGLPTVIGDSGGASETAMDSSYDVVVGGAPWQVAAAINQLLTGRHEGRRRQAPVYTWAAACQQVEQLLDSRRGAT